MAQLGRLSGHSFAYLHSSTLRELRRIAHLEAEAQFLRLLIQKQDGEDLVVDNFAHHLRDPAQRGIQIERCRQYVCDFQQQWLNRKIFPVCSEQTPFCFL